MRVRSVVLFCCLVISVRMGWAGAQEPWTEVRSPHFRVLTNGSAKDAQRVAANFEQMRYVFARQLPGFRLDSGAPLTIFALRDEKTSRKLDAWMWKRGGRVSTVLFKYGKERQYAMIRLDKMGTEPSLATNGQYAVAMLHFNSDWLTPWLEAGLANFYANTRIEKDRIEIGCPMNLGRTLHDNPIPVSQLISQRYPLIEKYNWNQVLMFHAESWALLHYLTFGEGMDGGQKLDQFFGLLQAGADQVEAFEQVFGSPQSMDKPLDPYMRNFAFRAAVISNPPEWKETDFTTRTLTPAETEAEMAGYRMWKGDSPDAHAMVAAALEENPKLGMAHEENGFLLFAQGSDAEAAAEFSTAYALDPKLYLSLFAKTMLSPAAQSNAPADEAALHDALEQVAELNPRFAPAYVEMARLEVRRGNLPLAFGLARRAEKLEPARAGYYLLTGEILLRMGNYADAAADAQYVAKRWKGANNDAAVELWNSIPVKERPAGVALAYEIQPGIDTMAGIVEQVNCGTNAGNSVVLRHNGKSLTFRISEQHTRDMPDTYWYGQNYFGLCHHLVGMSAVLRYKPDAGAATTGQMVELELRDPLPEAPAGKAEAKLAAKP